MAYSYIKSVFPKFESSKVYDERIYNSLSSLTSPNLSSFKPQPINEQLDIFTKNLVQPITQSTYKKSSDINAKKSEDKQNMDNLHFYNKPLPSLIINEKNTENIQNTENFNNEQTVEKMDCTTYTDHVLSCSKCSNMLSKQLGIINDKAKLEEIMELGSYIIFGIFILLLLESIKKK
jgi:hypothetical protein